MFFKKLIIICMLNTSLSLSSQMRNKVLLRQKNTCGMCKNQFTQMIPHEVHHLNHISNDNNFTNLLALCCNCHSAHHRYNISVLPYLKIEKI